MTTLIDYLANLNTVNNGYSLYVNPDDIDDYRIGQDCFENGGPLDEFVNVGRLDKLSFGLQNFSDAIENYLDNCGGKLKYKNKVVEFSKKGIVKAYSSGCLHHEFSAFLESKAEDTCKEWSCNEAELWVIDELPEILKQSVYQ